MATRQAAGVVLAVWFGYGCGTAHDGSGRDDRALTELARVGAKRLALEGFARWSMKSSSGACPSALAEIAEERSEAIDPWGHPYRLLCGSTLPAGVRGAGVYSFGPNGRDEDGHGDDVTSW